MKIVFRDAYKWFGASLADVVQSYGFESLELKTKTAKENFPLIYEFAKTRGYLDFLRLEDLCQKSFFPYNSFTEMSFLDRKNFPTKDEFWNSMVLGKFQISDENYEFALKIWNGLVKWAESRDIPVSFRIYANLYLELDCYLMAQCAIGMQEKFYQIYKKDILQYISLASYSFAVALTVIPVKLEALTCPNIYLHFSEGLLGGYCDPLKQKLAFCINNWNVFFNVKNRLFLHAKWA